jgi:hypothetical protein
VAVCNIEKVAGIRLRRSAQFAPEPTRRFAGFHRIHKLHHLLMDVIASWALECPDIEARVTRGDSRQHGSGLACGATWSEDDHNARLRLRREYDTLSRRIDAITRPAIEPSCRVAIPTRCFILLTFTKKLMMAYELIRCPIQFEQNQNRPLKSLLLSGHAI